VNTRFNADGNRETRTINAQGILVDGDGNAIIEHEYLEGTGGQPLRFLRRTEEPCPLCGRGPRPNVIGVLAEALGQETVHCLTCDYQTTRRPGPRTTHRPMNSGNGRA